MNHQSLPSNQKIWRSVKLCATSLVMEEWSKPTSETKRETEIACLQSRKRKKEHEQKARLSERLRENEKSQGRGREIENKGLGGN